MSGSAPLSAWERWTWARCREPILGLKQRLGYGERLWILGFELLDEGRLWDPFHGVEVFDPAKAGPPKLIEPSFTNSRANSARRRVTGKEQVRGYDLRERAS